ncbi:MAG: AI-2E family transporter [Trueperaceae bacterium]
MARPTSDKTVNHLKSEKELSDSTSQDAPASTPPKDASTNSQVETSKGNTRRNVTAFEIVWRSPWVRAVTFLVLGLLLLWILWTTRKAYAFALQVGVIGFGIAYVLNPVVEALRRIKVRRSFGVVIVYVGVVALLVLGSVLITNVVTDLSRLSQQLPDAFNNIGALTGRISAWFTRIVESLPTFLSSRFGVQTSSDELSQQVQTQLTGFLSNLVESVNSFLQRVARDGPSILLSGATNVLSTTAQIFLILLTSAYFLYDYPRFTTNFKRFVPVRWRPLYEDITAKADVAVGGYIRGQLLITSIIGILIFVGLSIVGVPSAPAISFLAALFNLVPYLGPIVGVIPAVILGFTVSPLTALLAVVVFVVANQIEGNVLGPYILSKSTNLHPVTVLLVILVGAGMFGLLGALLAVPVAALLKVVLEEYLLKRPAYQTTKPQAADESQSLE